MVLEELNSTNDYARKMGDAGAPHGSWISARTQTAGRGRLGREWKSASGNLFLSVVIRPEKSIPLNWVPLAAALAVFRTAQAAQPGLDLVVKWPNDLGVRDRKVGFRKVGGILCEGVGSSAGTFIVAGIGLNCAIAPDADQPTSALGVSVDAIRPRVLENLLQVLSLPLSAIRSAYESASLLSKGDAIEWRDLRNPDPSALPQTGVFSGYGENGELLVSRDGRSERLYSEEIKLVLPKKA